MTRSKGWVPGQHGAWAMIAVPYLAGIGLAGAVRPLHIGDLLLGLTWLAGYFAFNAATLTVKSPAKRRSAYYVPLATYLGASSAFGFATLAFKGPALLWWVPGYAVVLGIALWLAAHRKERSLTSGVLMVLASCALMAVLRLTPSPIPLSAHEMAVMAAVTLYFVGTVLHVKALIRERNDPRSAGRSIAFHAALAALVVAAVSTGLLGWAWAVWAVALVVRTWWMPRSRRTPAQIGILEIVLSAALLALSLVG